MAFYAEDEDAWKCPKHPPRRRRNGVCPACLRERLGTLCPDCANVRPCPCCAVTSSSSSSSASSTACDGLSSSGRVANLIETEPAFRRSRSVGIPYLRSRFAFGDKENSTNDQKNITPKAKTKGKTLAFWSIFKSKKRSKGEENRENEESKETETEDYLYRSRIDDFERMVMRSRSVSVTMTSLRGGSVRSSPSKGKGWHFMSPMKVFRQKSSSKVALERSPLHRG